MQAAALIVAAGKGERAGGGVPKQFRKIGGRSLVAHAIAAFDRHPAIGPIAVVVAPGQEAALAEYAGSVLIVTGGAERQDSVAKGLAALAAVGCDVVLIHDAARPFLAARVIDDLLTALERSDGAIPALPVVDTLARNGETLGETVDRAQLVRVQTPQAFRFAAIVEAHETWAGGAATDDAQMARAAGFSVITVAGDVMLEKITHEADFAAAEARLAQALVSRTGMGFDVHRLEDGRPLWLGGVQIPHHQGLAGHSDADVALHAIVDALLGAIGAGDIGSHFPPTDPQWKGADSARFITHAADLIAQAGGIIDHVDLTIICEAPKIGPHREAMRERIAALLAVDPSRISVKATTTERLGFTGRGEGIAAQAVATVRS